MGQKKQNISTAKEYFTVLLGLIAIIVIAGIVIFILWFLGSIGNPAMDMDHGFR